VTESPFARSGEDPAARSEEVREPCPLIAK
jgi:hypothetical protein